MRVRTAGGRKRSPGGHTPLERRVELNKRYKDKVEKLWAAGCWERPSPRLRPSPAGGRTGRCSAGTHVRLASSGSGNRRRTWING